MYEEKKGIIRITCIIVVVTVVGVFSFLKSSSAKNEENIKPMEEYAQSDFMDQDGNNASGTITSGTDYEYFSVSINSPLEVEEVYVESGTQVTTHSAICKVTDESYNALKKQLRKNMETAKRELSQATIDYKVDMLSLQSDYSTETAVTDTAYDAYEITIENLASNVELAKSEWEDAVTIIETYPEKISKSNTRKKSANKKLKRYKKNLEQLQSSYDTATEEYNKAKQQYENAESELEEIQTVQAYLEKYAGGGSQNNGANPSVGQQAVVSAFESTTANGQETSEGNEFSVFKEYVKKQEDTCKQQYTETLEKYEAAKKDWENKEEKYEKKQEQIVTLENKIETLSTIIKNYKTELEEAEDSVDSLKANYDKSCADQVTETVKAEKELQQNLLVQGSASVSYRISAANLLETLEEAEETYQEALEAWNTFEDTFEEGIWYAQRAGDISYLGCEAGGFLTNETPILGYYNGNTMSVEVTVGQSEISEISVGDQVSVSTNSIRRSLAGIVSKIDSQQNSSSVSKVTYAVTITVENEENRITSGDTATVYFAENISNKNEKEEME